MERLLQRRLYRQALRQADGGYEKLKRQDGQLEAQFNAIDAAPDYHTKDNRDKGNTLEGKRNVIAANGFHQSKGGRGARCHAAVLRNFRAPARSCEACGDVRVEGSE
jgi:hypothetical protein